MSTIFTKEMDGVSKLSQLQCKYIQMVFSVCQPIDRDEDPLSSPYRVAVAFYWKYLINITKLIDTIILVGRKKFRRVTASHLWLQCCAVLICWIFARYAPGGHETIGIMTGMGFYLT